MSDLNETIDQALGTFCAVHPTIETALRCNKCDRYMCTKCAVSTPVGYRCRDCVRQHDDKFFVATNLDPLIVAAICGISGGIAAALLHYLGAVLVFFTFVLGLPLGALIGQATLWAVQKRRGRYYVYWGVGAAAAVGLIVLFALRGVGNLWAIVGLVIMLVGIYGILRVK
jgi:hypothetical protein